MTDRIAEPAPPSPIAEPAPPPLGVAETPVSTPAGGAGAGADSPIAQGLAAAGADRATSDAATAMQSASGMPFAGETPADPAFRLVTELTAFLDKGGIAMWLIAALSVVTLALILLKLWRLARVGAWHGRNAEAAVALWCRGDHAAAAEAALRGRGLRARLAAAAIGAVRNHGGAAAEAREETTRIARRLLAETASGLRALELIATVAPLLGLFGTVLGMIGAFQALQSAGVRADPSALAGGIWEALLTTAAGMAVAIPASAALTWFESVTDRVRLDMEDIATRIFTRSERPALARAAE